VHYPDIVAMYDGFRQVVMRPVLWNPHQRAIESMAAANTKKIMAAAAARYAI
jgi:hypothetical protein